MSTHSYHPTLESVSEHPVPAWFDNAKLGIFIHWGLYSVPAWAHNSGNLGETQETGNWTDWFAQNPYAEWYANTVRIAGSPTQRHHFDTYGHGFAYTDFAPMFNAAVEAWDPDEWAGFFNSVGARYVVLTSKHHDGFLLWPSLHPNPYHPDYFCQRDLLDELGKAVRAQGLRMAYYYSGGVDWTFNPQVVRSIPDLRRATPQSNEYVAYANAHWYELMSKYETAILWNDIAYPQQTNTNLLFADYYNQMPEGVVNNRFNQFFDASGSQSTARVHYDYATPEYQQYDAIQLQKWESCRGIGASFGYNQLEGGEQYLSAESLIHSFVDIVSKNGNLLINVGPTAQGIIPEIQRERLTVLGTWLDVNGNAIFDTRPWIRAEAKTDSGVEVRFTQDGRSLFAILLGGGQAQEFLIPGLTVSPDTEVEVLGQSVPAQVLNRNGGLVIRTETPLSNEIGSALRISPIPAE